MGGGGGCHGFGADVDDSGITLITDVAFHLVVNVGVDTRRWWLLAGGGGRGEAGVIGAVILRRGVLHLGGGSGQER